MFLRRSWSLVSSLLSSSFWDSYSKRWTAGKPFSDIGELEDSPSFINHESGSMKSLTKLWSALALDCAEQCDTSCARDIITMRERVKHEGDSFLTITLPSYASDFEKSLEQGRIGPNLFLSFKKRSGLPVFLQGFLDQVFDRSTGIIREEPSHSSIRAIRQLTLVFKKIERPTTEARNRAAEAAYVNCEIDLEAKEKSISDEQRHDFSRSFAWLYSDVLNDLTKAIEKQEVKPKHGPGSTQDKLLGNRKWQFPKWTSRLEEVFPYARFCTHTWRTILDYSFDLLPPDREPPVKVVFVPKTQKTPRVIAMEPTHMQYVQQALMRELVSLLEKSRIGASQGFSDQEPNRAKAREGSVTGAYATIDLSEASDRVLASLIYDALAPWPTVQEAVMSSRSSRSELPSGKILTLKKFASMGSALCFPIEVMAFSAIIFTAMRSAGGYPAKEALRVFAAGEVRVYGDDIIVPVYSVDYVEEFLEVFGLKVNRSKSFSKGKFRESCGGDYYDGTDVTPVRIRRDLPTHKQHVEELVSASSSANQFADGGYDRASEYLHTTVEAILPLYPDVPRDSDLLGRWSFDPKPSGYSAKLHCPIYRGYAPYSKAPKSLLTGYRALFKALSGSWDDPMYRDHLTHAGRPITYALKRSVRAVS